MWQKIHESQLGHIYYTTKINAFPKQLYWKNTPDEISISPDLVFLWGSSRATGQNFGKPQSDFIHFPRNGSKLRQFSGENEYFWKIVMLEDNYNALDTEWFFY